MSARRGLPSAIRMRHTQHYVDNLVFNEGEVVGRMVEIERIQPNPQQPRRDLGDLQGLAQSISEHGVLEPLLVTLEADRYQIVAGERRFRAAQLAGLSELPCIVKNLDEQQIVEIALVENLQRKDLDPFEEADGLKTLQDRFSYTHEMIAAKIGRSRPSVTETLALCKLGSNVRAAIGEAGITAKSLMLSVAKQESEAEQLAVVARIRAGAGRDEVRREGKKQTRQQPFVFRFKDPDKHFRLDLRFKRSAVSRQELMGALRQILAQMESMESEEQSAQE